METKLGRALRCRSRVTYLKKVAPSLGVAVPGDVDVVGKRLDEEFDLPVGEEYRNRAFLH